MDQVNSAAAGWLLSHVVRRGAPGGGGVSVLLRPCAASGCMHYAAAPRAPAASVPAVASTEDARCPLHRAEGEYGGAVDKASAPYCGNCFELFPAGGGTTTAHHCHVCGAAVCAACGDYVLDKSVHVPVPFASPNANSALARLGRSLLHQPGERRACIACAAALHPTAAVKQTTLILPGSKHVPLDVVFVFDATASMGPHIDLVEEQIDDIVEDVHRHHLVDLRCAGVAYRDHAYGPRLVNVIPFQNHHHKFRRMIDHIRAFAAHGNDIPEAMAPGLAVAQALGWRPLAAKVLLIFTDAPPHRRGLTQGAFATDGPAFAGSIPHDLFPRGDPTGLDPLALVRSLHADGVATYTVGVEPDASQSGADRTLRTLAAAGAGLFIGLQPHDHRNLHRYIAAALCDFVMKAVCAQELDGEADPGNGPAHDAAVRRVAARLRSRNMPRFVFSRPPSAGALPVVAGVHWDYMQDSDVLGYVQGVDRQRAAPPTSPAQAQPQGSGGSPAQAWSQSGSPAGWAGQPGRQPFGAYAPGPTQGSAYGPAYAPTYAPGPMQGNAYGPAYAPGLMQGNVYTPAYAPGPMQGNAYSTRPMQASAYNPSPMQGSAYSPGPMQGNLYAPGPTQGSAYTSGPMQGSAYTSGAMQGQQAGSATSAYPQQQGAQPPRPPTKADEAASDQQPPAYSDML